MKRLSLDFIIKPLSHRVLSLGNPTATHNPPAGGPAGGAPRLAPPMHLTVQKILTIIPKWCIYLVFLIITAVFFIWRYKYGLQRYFDIDEFAHLHWAHNAFIGQRPYTDFFYFFPPVYLYLLSTVFLFVGKSVAILIVSRQIAFVISLLCCITLFLLVREIRDTKTALITSAVFAFLPIPVDKWIETRPDTVAVLFTLLGILFLIYTLHDSYSEGPDPVTSLQGKRSVFIEGVYPDEVRAPRLASPLHFIIRKLYTTHKLVNSRFLNGFLAGFFLLLAVGVVPKVIFFLIIAVLVVVIYAFLHRDTTAFKKQILPVQLLQVAVFKGFILGALFVSVAVFVLLIYSGNITKAILLTTKIASDATNVLAHKFYILPNFIFYPNDVYYGGAGYTVQWTLNFIIWMTAIVWSVVHLVSPLNTKNASSSLIKFLLAACFYLNLYAFVNIFPVHHEQYLLTLSPFVAYFFADLLVSVVEAVKNRAGKLSGVIMECILLFGFAYVLYYAGVVMYHYRLSWTGNRLGYYQKLYQDLTVNEPIFDLSGETIFARDGYYFCCVPYGQYIEALAFPIPGLENALRKNRVRLIYVQDIGRVGVLPADQQKVVRDHYLQLPDGTKPNFLFTGSNLKFPGTGVEKEIDLIAGGRFDIYWNGKKLSDKLPATKIKIDGENVNYNPQELSAGIHRVKTDSPGDLAIIWSGS
jgi:hypothetical protein